MLVSIADALRSVSGDEAIIGRFGNDEFTVLLPYIEHDSLEELIIQLRKTYAEDIVQGSEKYKATCSIGASRYAVDGVTLGEMLKHADSALYYVKKTGRDSYAICTEAIKKQFCTREETEFSEEPKKGNRRVSEEITEFALDLLEGSKDLKTALNLLLMKVGKRFSLAAVSIREYDETESL